MTRAAAAGSWFRGVAVGGWLAVVSAAAAQTAVEQATVPAAVDDGLVTAIRRQAAATVKAFEGGDAAALAGMFLTDGELIDEDGNVFSGREQIADLFTRFFARFPNSTLDMEVTSARRLGDDVAVEEGVRRITAADGASAAQMRYVAVRDKQGDAWPIASYREFADDPAPTPREMLATLDWLVGDWVDESPEGRTAISYRWSEDGNFLLGDYEVSLGGRATSKSVQRIGWNPVDGELRSWTFDSDGGYTEGKWAPTDDGWLIRSEAVLPDGGTGSATVTVRQQDADHLVVESTDRVVAGVEEPDFRLVIVRRPPAPAAKP